MELHYTVSIEWNPIDKTYFAKVPDLPGCTAFGDTYETALEEAKTAMELWIKTAKEIGREIPHGCGGEPRALNAPQNGITAYSPRRWG